MLHLVYLQSKNTISYEPKTPCSPLYVGYCTDINKFVQPVNAEPPMFDLAFLENEFTWIVKV